MSNLFKPFKKLRPKHTCYNCKKSFRVSLIPTTIGGLCKMCHEVIYKSQILEKIVEESVVDNTVLDAIKSE